MCFMHHDDQIFAWTGKDKELRHIAENAHNMYYLSDDAFFYMTTEEIEVNGRKVQSSKVYMVEAQFGNFQSTWIY